MFASWCQAPAHHVRVQRPEAEAFGRQPVALPSAAAMHRLQCFERRGAQAGRRLRSAEGLRSATANDSGSNALARRVVDWRRAPSFDRIE
jgi:hypothetical protein